MIPKRIYYAWFGDKPMPELAYKCIESWKEYCPDYEIIKISEENYDFEQNKFMKQAYEEKQWAFVADYARLDTIYKYGGIYLDIDVELIKNLDDLLENTCYMGCELVGQANMGNGFGAEKGHWFIKEHMDYYKNMDFEMRASIISPKVTTKLLKNHGFQKINEIQKIKDITVYPTDYLCPLSMKTGKLTITENTYSIHQFLGSWVSDSEFKRKLNFKLLKYFLFIENTINKIFGEGSFDKFVEKFENLKKKIKGDKKK